MDRVQRHLMQHNRVHGVQVNTQTGSVLVKGERDFDLESILRDALNIVETATAADPQDAAVEAVVDVVKRANDRLRQATSGRMSVRLLVPSLFIGIGLRQLLREGLTLGAVPWYVLIYYGVDSFMKLYPEYAPRAAASSNAGTGR